MFRGEPGTRELPEDTLAIREQPVGASMLFCSQLQLRAQKSVMHLSCRVVTERRHKSRQGSFQTLTRRVVW